MTEQPFGLRSAERGAHGNHHVIAWFLHYGHGVPLEALADQFGYSRDALYRRVRRGREITPRRGDEPTRVPRVFDLGREPSAKPRPPYRVTFAHAPHRFDWDHAKPMAFRWTDEHGEHLVLPLDRNRWEKVGPTTYRVRITRTGTVYLPDGTPLEIDQKMLDEIVLEPGSSFDFVLP